MMPSSLFYDLIDAQIAFKVVQRNFNGPNFVFSVPRAKDGQLRLTMLGGQALVGSGEAVLARLNALLCENPASQPHTLSLRHASASHSGRIVSFVIRPEADKGRQQGIPDELPVECHIMTGDYPNVDREMAVVSAVVGKKQSLHLMELVGKDNFQEISRLSPHALPREIHEKLAANGYYENSFVALYGEAALEKAKMELEAAYSNWTAVVLDVLPARRQGLM
jgi:hypothetical protein